MRGAASCLLLPATLVAAGGPTTEPDDPVFPPSCIEGQTKSSIALLDAELFVDPQGTYEMLVDVDWLQSNAVADVGIEAWLLGEAVDGLPPNVTLFSEVTPMDLEDYLEFSIAQFRAQYPDFELVESGTVEGTAEEIHVLGTAGNTDDGWIYFLIMFAFRDGTAVAATLTSPPSAFGELRCQVEPFFLTLRLTP